MRRLTTLIGAADLVVVNTCAFIDAARQESIDTVLNLADRRRAGAHDSSSPAVWPRRYGDELREALPEVDLVAGFGSELTDPLVPHPQPPQPCPCRHSRAGRRRRPAAGAGFDLLELPRPAAQRAPWASTL